MRYSGLQRDEKNLLRIVQLLYARINRPVVQMNLVVVRTAGEPFTLTKSVTNYCNLVYLSYLY